MEFSDYLQWDMVAPFFAPPCISPDNKFYDDNSQPNSTKQQNRTHSTPNKQLVQQTKLSPSASTGHLLSPQASNATPRHVGRTTIMRNKNRSMTVAVFCTKPTLIVSQRTTKNTTEWTEGWALNRVHNSRRPCGAVSLSGAARLSRRDVLTLLIHWWAR